MNKRTANMIFGALVLLAGAVMTYYSLKVKGGHGRHELGAYFFPTLASAALGALGLFTLVKEAVAGVRDPIRFVNRRFLAGVAAIVVYTALLERLGYIVSGVLMAMTIMLLMCNDPLRKKWPFLVIVAVAAPLGIYWIFAKFLLVPLP